METNLKVRQALKDAGLTFWQLADLIGKSEPTVTRMMRHELPAEEQDKIIDLIKRR